MVKQVIIMTHTNLAKGFHEALTFLTGENQVHFICAYSVNLKPELDLIRLLEQFETTDQVFVLTDLMGGSVNHIATNLINQYRFHLITGINLGLILEIVLLPEESISEYSIREIIDHAKTGIMYMNDQMDELHKNTGNEEEMFFA